MTITIPIEFIWAIGVLTFLIVLGLAVFGGYVLYMIMQKDGSLGWYKQQGTKGVRMKKKNNLIKRFFESDFYYENSNEINM